MKSKIRIHNHGEVFTAEREVNAMLDLVKAETKRIESKFLEPACGNGNFLIEIFRRKLAVVKKLYHTNQIKFEKHAVLAVSSIYGIDLLDDNIWESRGRLFDAFNKIYSSLYNYKCKGACDDSIQFILNRNIIQGDALTLQTDSKGPIIFSEWNFVSPHMVERKEFTFRELIEKNNIEALPLFSEIYKPQPFKVHKKVHFLEIGKR